MSAGRKETTEKSEKSEEVSFQGRKEVIRKDIKSKDQSGEEHSQCSNEESAASSATGQRHHSPTADTMATSGSGASSPSQSVSNVDGSIDRNDVGNEVQQDKGIIGDDPQTNADDGAKASWESGILDLSSSSFLTVKFLVSNNMAGSIIGRAGETISELQEQSSSRIKLGQSGDYYPGTSERACLVHGSLENVKKAATLLLQKLYDLQVHQVESQLGRHSTQTSKGALKDGAEGGAKENVADDETKKEDGGEISSTNISFSVRMLIPSASCGMLIGRNGINIKKMKLTSRVTSIRLSAKELDHANSNMHFSSESMAIAATSERILTITGNELNACISCAFLILEGFARHPDICRYANNTTSYSKITSSFQSHYGSSQLAYPVRSSSGGSMPSVPQTRGNRPSPPYLPSHHSQNVQRLQRAPMRFSGDRPHDSAIRIDDRRNQHQQQLYRNTSIVSPQLGAQVSSHLQPAPIYGSMPAAPRHTQDTQQQVHAVKISVSDTMVGAILGKRGQTLVELENKSGTKIKISQRGEFIPGTNNRIVTISGPNNECIASAKSLIRQQLATHDRMISSPLPDEES